MTEDELRKITIGEPKVVNDTIAVIDYDANWPKLYEKQAWRIRTALSDRVLCLEHVGSTSVPGLAAKPIIDIVLAVADSADEAAYIPTLENTGYVLQIREPEFHQHRMLKGTDPNVNLHCYSGGCPEIDRLIRFRNWLRANADDRLLYERTKRELAARTWKYVQDYADAKTAVVQEILERCFL